MSSPSGGTSPAAPSWPKPASISWRPCADKFPRGLDDDIANRALANHTRQTTVPQPGRCAPAVDQLLHTADFTEPDRWWIAGTGGKPPRESSRYERARVASLALHNAIRTTTLAEHRTQDEHDQEPPHTVDRPGRDAALTPKQRA
ncbi:hypothetical protein ACIBRY_35440 [Streptomyces anulatus]